MITVTIDDDILLNILIDRVTYWTDDSYEQDLFRDYYRNLIDCGGFNNCELDINNIVDNDYVNNLAIISKEDFEQWNIEDETSDKIEAFNEEEDLYLVRTY